MTLTDEEFCKAARMVQPDDGSLFAQAITRLEKAVDTILDLEQTVSDLGG